MEERRKIEINFKDPLTIVLLVIGLPVTLALGWAVAAYVILPYMVASLTVLGLLGLACAFRLHRYI